ncbi:uncharacterized protein LOC117172753 [Belonocnema kinseyi]|uniref:uncharacterized protein LOC117172753 n=1 Tax=Belonocnema kinseyi TaxID=2817044 RepID=UPI00143CF6A6|nr:uncharacterized protein LOC117172753 [Belonocnema kinseyi]
MHFQGKKRPLRKWGKKSEFNFSDIDENDTQENPAINQFVNNNRNDRKSQKHFQSTKKETKVKEFKSQNPVRKYKSIESLIKKLKPKESKVLRGKRSQFRICSLSEEAIKRRRTEFSSQRKRKNADQIRKPPPIPSNILQIFDLFQHDSLLKFVNQHYKPKIEFSKLKFKPQGVCHLRSLSNPSKIKDVEIKCN